MVETETAALALGGGVLATEALGLTNFSGGGGGVNPRVLQAALESASSGAGQVIPVPSGDGGGGSGAPTGQVLELAMEVGKLQGQVPDTGGAGERLSDTVDRGRDFIRVPTGGDPSGGNRGGPNPSGGPSRYEELAADNREGDTFDLQDLRNPKQGVQGGDVIAATGEGGKAFADTTSGTVDTLKKTGNTFAQAGRALTGKRYSTENTFQESTDGGTERRLYQGSLAHQGGQVVNDIIPGTPLGAWNGGNGGFL